MKLLTKGVREQFGMRRAAGNFGIEVELEGQFAGLRPVDGWEVHQDGSLRNGLEFASNPTSDPRGAVTALQTSLELCQLNLSYRCSTHIHVNFQTKTFKDVIAFYIAWAALEPLFLSRFPDRSGSIYCLSAYECGDMPIAFNRFCQSMKMEFYDGFNARQKYSSLNLLRLSDLGTIECRIFPASIDPIQVETWCGWLTRLSEFTARYGSDQMLPMVRYMEKNPMAVAGEIFAGDVPFSYSDTGLLMDLGARNAYEMARIFNAAMKAEDKPKVKKKIELDGWGDPVAVEEF